jgi:hypothetical protein
VFLLDNFTHCPQCESGHLTTAAVVMSPTATTTTYERNNETGLTDSTHSSSSSAIRYDLDEVDQRPILVYKYRSGLQTTSQKDLCEWLDKGEWNDCVEGVCPPIAMGIGDISMIAREQRKHVRMTLLSNTPIPRDRRKRVKRQICNTNANQPTDESLRVTKKPIPRATSYLDVKRHDLYLPDEKQQYAKLPNFNSNLASIKVPSLAYWFRLFLGGYSDLYIVSPESSPNSSVADDDSRRTSPTSTWANDDNGDARLGATGGDDIRS